MSQKPEAHPPPVEACELWRLLWVDPRLALAALKDGSRLPLEPAFRSEAGEFNEGSLCKSLLHLADRSSRCPVEPELLAELLGLLWPKPPLIAAVLGALLRELAFFFAADSPVEAALASPGSRGSGFILAPGLLQADSAGKVPWLERLFEGFELNFLDFVPPCWPYYPTNWSEPDSDPNLTQLNWGVTIAAIRRGFAHLELREQLVAGVLELSEPGAVEDFCFRSWPTYCGQLGGLCSAATAHLFAVVGELSGFELALLPEADLSILLDLLRGPAVGLPPCFDPLARLTFCGFRCLVRGFARLLPAPQSWAWRHPPPLLGLPYWVLGADKPRGSDARSSSANPVSRRAAAASLTKLINRLRPAVVALPPSPY
jgi:hypothetical protein